MVCNSRGRSRLHRLILAAFGAGALALVAPTASALDAVNHVREVKVAAERDDATEIEVATASQPAYTLRVEAQGKRLVLDIPNADVASAVQAITRQAGVVGGVLAQEFKTDAGAMARVTVNLVKNAYYRVRVDGSALKISLRAAETTGPMPPAMFDSAKEKGGGKADAPTAELVSVKFSRDKACQGACDKVRVQLSQVPAYALSSSGSKLRLELRGVRATGSVLERQDLAREKSTIRSVTTSYDAERNATLVDIDRAGEGSGVLSVEGNTLVWAFEANAKPAPITSITMQGSRKVTTIARDPSPGETSKIETSILGGDGPGGVKVETIGGQEAGFVQSVNAQAARGYTGRRIDLDLKDADIHNILRLLADVGRVNVVTADDVSGTITIRMRNVPWDQALDVVLQAKGLGMVRSGNLIRVAQLSQLQKERELRIAALKQEYELTPLETRLIPVSYATADSIQPRTRELLSPRGTVAVDERTNVLIARDIPGNLNNIEELVRSLDTQTPQVLIEARVVEATSRYQRDIGIQWGGDASFTEAGGNPTGVAFPSSLKTAGGAYDGQAPTQGISPLTPSISTPNFAVNLPAAVGTGRGAAVGFSLGSIDNNFNLSLRLSAAEASGLLRVVSSPRVLTLDNSEARINSGTLIPFAQISAQGVQTTFQEAKLQLLVKPHVTADGAVSLRVKVNRDEPDFNQTSPRGDPTILKREVETDLLVLDGHTAVIGGIYTRNTGRNVDQVPFFGDIPILGILFQRRRASDIRQELVIFITPRIVNRAEALGR